VKGGGKEKGFWLATTPAVPEPTPCSFLVLGLLDLQGGKSSLRVDQDIIPNRGGKDSDMTAYKFYQRDAAKNRFEQVGVLPERRRNRERITDASIINWGRKYFGKSLKDEDVFLVETFLRDSERQFFLPLSDQI
jgi:hypothetical protein